MNRDFEKWGKDIRNTIEDAIENKDFSQLNQTITSTVNDAINEARKGMQSTGQMFYKNVKIPEPAGKQPPAKQQDLFAKTNGTKVGGLALAITGGILCGGLGLITFITALVLLFSGGFGIGGTIVLSTLLPLLIGSGVMTIAGSRMIGSSNRFQKYLGVLRGRTYCNIEELAEASRKSIGFIVKDIKKMINKGWFKEGHLDESETCLITSHTTYQEYKQLTLQRKEQARLEQAKAEENITKREPEKVKTEIEKVMEEGNRYLKKIKESNEKIPGVEISNKISHMELLIKKIFDRVEENPDTLDDIEKLMEYYLPTTVKLLDAYEQLDKQPIQGENIKSSKKEIEDTLDTLNVAFEKLLDSLFEDVAWDVSSDISVLHTMLAQEGLTERDFKGGE